MASWCTWITHPHTLGPQKCCLWTLFFFLNFVLKLMCMHWAVLVHVKLTDVSCFLLRVSPASNHMQIALLVFFLVQTTSKGKCCLDNNRPSASKQWQRRREFLSKKKEDEKSCSEKQRGFEKPIKSRRGLPFSCLLAAWCQTSPKRKLMHPQTFQKKMKKIRIYVEQAEELKLFMFWKKTKPKQRQKFERRKAMNNGQ